MSHNANGWVKKLPPNMPTYADFIRDPEKVFDNPLFDEWVLLCNGLTDIPHKVDKYLVTIHSPALASSPLATEVYDISSRKKNSKDGWDIVGLTRWHTMFHLLDACRVTDKLRSFHVCYDTATEGGFIEPHTFFAYDENSAELVMYRDNEKHVLEDEVRDNVLASLYASAWLTMVSDFELQK